MVMVVLMIVTMIAVIMLVTMVMVVMLIVNGVLMMTDGDEKVHDDRWRC